MGDDRFRRTDAHDRSFQLEVGLLLQLIVLENRLLDGELGSAVGLVLLSPAASGLTGRYVVGIAFVGRSSSGRGGPGHDILRAGWLRSRWLARGSSDQASSRRRSGRQGSGASR